MGSVRSIGGTGLGSRGSVRSKFFFGGGLGSIGSDGVPCTKRSKIAQFEIAAH